MARKRARGASALLNASGSDRFTYLGFILVLRLGVNAHANADFNVCPKFSMKFRLCRKIANNTEHAFPKI